MAPTQSPRAAAIRRSRQSIAHLPSSERIMDKENNTIHNLGAIRQQGKVEKRGLRSKSLGAGELKALKEGSGNPQKIQPLPRSILKPTIPLSPLKTAADVTRRISPRRSNNSNSADQSDGDIRNRTSGERDSDDSATRIGLRTEEEQQAAARERERRDAEKHREERRKSLANRRVSFAPEATLHTWDVVELPEDATSSTEATSSTRRGSRASRLSGSSHQGSNEPMSDSSDIPSTPEGEIQVAASPADQRSASQQQFGRSVGVNSTPQIYQHEFSSSPIGSVASDDTNSHLVHADDDVIDASDSDEDRDVEAEETLTSAAIDNNDLSEDSDGSESPREDFSMERVPSVVRDPNNSFSSPSPERQNVHQNVSLLGEEEDLMDMEITAPVGGILRSTIVNQDEGQSKGLPKPEERRNTRASGRFSLGQTSAMGDETMEFTTAIGSIQPGQHDEDTGLLDLGDNEDISMEFTSVVGGLQHQQPFGRPENASHGLYHQAASLLDEDDMDITVARGGILSPVTERTEPSDESATAMDFTAAVGAILPSGLQAKDRDEAKLLMEEEADHGQLTRSPFSQEPARFEHTENSNSEDITTASSKADAPNAEVRHRSSMSPTRRNASSPRRLTTPVKAVSTPRKQLTPQPGRPTTPSKTPPAKNVSMRKTSPKSLFRESTKKQSSVSPARPRSASKSPAKPSGLLTGQLPLNLVLTPRSGRQTNNRFEPLGLGSPQVAAVLDRRISIGEQAETFTPLGPGAMSVRFADPRVMEYEVDQERAEEHRRESGRSILQEETNQPNEDNDTTSNLRGMIDGLTPKKNKINGRKSLAVGAAKGLLGKRPSELDEEDEDATPKRLRGMPHSPVKQIHLPAPPTKTETTGRLGRSSNFGSRSVIESMSTPLVRPSPRKTASTPKDQGRFHDTKTFQSAEKPPVSFNEQLAGESALADEPSEDERIHLRDFLNMTSIRFMELTTTKRRHTVLPGKDGDDTTTTFGVAATGEDDRSLASCVVAGASTIPMLELYQHSCRELKKYIAEGRNIVKEIEDDTFEDNPLLFREYMSAPPQMRALMDNQFKNVKTHARLLSKGMWYEWRMKLLDGLQEGLEKIKTGLDKDQQSIIKHEQILQPIMPELIEEHEAVRLAASSLQQQAEELANCDQEELRVARGQLTGLDEEIAAMRRQVDALKTECKEKDQSIEALLSRKSACQEEIKEAEAVRETYRGWSAAEVGSLKDRADSLERSTGWKVSAAHGETVTFTYKSSLSIYLTPSSFQGHGPADRPNTTIKLSCPTNDAAVPTVDRFFLQLLRARVLSISQAQTPLRDVLKLVENGWDLARRVSEQSADLRALWPTSADIKGDDRLRVTSTVLLRNSSTKIEAGFELVVGGVNTETSATMSTSVSTIYGEDLKADKMAHVLRRESGVDKEVRSIGHWAKALGTLEDKVTQYLQEKQT